MKRSQFSHIASYGRSKARLIAVSEMTIKVRLIQTINYDTVHYIEAGLPVHPTNICRSASSKAVKSVRSDVSERCYIHISIGAWHLPDQDAVHPRQNIKYLFCRDSLGEKSSLGARGSCKLFHIYARLVMI